VVALVVLLAVFLALRGTVWGLQLKAVGKSLAGANLLGVPTERRLLGAYALCGACAGLAGAFLVVMVHHRLIPGISSGYGFLSILIVLLTGFRALLVIPVALFFSAVSIGSTALQLDLQLDSSLGGVLQAAIVLCFLLVQGVREKWFSRAARTT
jgi:simple sugar transport system permease protein